MPSTVDSSIPLSINPAAKAGPDLSEVWAMAEANARNRITREKMVLEAREERARNALSARSIDAQTANAAPLNQLRNMEIQRQQRVQSVYDNPANLTPNGDLTIAGQQRLFQADPQTGLEYRRNQLTVRQQEQRSAVLNSEMFQRKVDMTTDANGAALETYEEAIKAGKPPEQAQAAAQRVFSDGMDRVRQSGLFSESEQKQLSPSFDPERARSYTQASKEWREERRKTMNPPPAQAAEADAQAVANEKIAARRAELGRDLTQAEQAAIRQEARNAPKVELAKEKATAAEPSIDAPTRRKMAEQYLAGDKSIFQNLGRGAQGSANIAALRKDIFDLANERGMSGEDIAAKIAEFAGITSGERTLGTRTANIGMAVSEAKLMIPLALTASDKVNRSQYPALNSILLAGERGTGSEDVVRLGVATNSLINIYARAISPTGVPTVSDKDHARELLSAAWSQGQYHAGVDQLMQELNAASQAPAAVREEFRQSVSGKGSAPGDGGGTGGAGAGAQQASAAASMPHPTTQEDYDKLPSGTKYMHPDGKVKVKP